MIYVLFLATTVVFQASGEITLPGNVLPIQSPVPGGGWTWSTQAFLKQRLGEPEKRLKEGRAAEWWIYQTKGVWFRIKIDPDQKQPVLPDGGLVDAVRLVTREAGSIRGARVGDKIDKGFDSVLGPGAFAKLFGDAKGTKFETLKIGASWVEIGSTQSNTIGWLQLNTPTLKPDIGIGRTASAPVKLYISPVSLPDGLSLDSETKAAIREAVHEHFTSKPGELKPTWFSSGAKNSEWSAFPFVTLVDSESESNYLLDISVTSLRWTEVNQAHETQKFKCPAVEVLTTLKWRLRSTAGASISDGELSLVTSNSREHKPGKACDKPDQQQVLPFGVCPRVSLTSPIQLWEGGSKLADSLLSLGPVYEVREIDPVKGLIGFNAGTISYSSQHRFSITLYGMPYTASTAEESPLVLGGPPRVEYLKGFRLADGVMWCEVDVENAFGTASIDKKWRLLGRLPDVGCRLLRVRQIASTPSLLIRLGGSISSSSQGMTQMLNLGPHG